LRPLTLAQTGGLAITVENEFDHYNPAQPDMAASWSSYLDLVFWHTL